MSKQVAIAIHGGAGTILKNNITPEKEALYKQALTSALYAGHNLLMQGQSALDAVEAAVKYMENCDLFNAGKGAVLTSQGHCELDASIMDGNSLSAGAIAGARRVKNPISVARAVMEKSVHVLLAGNGADQFANENGLEMVADPDSYFITPFRREQLEIAKSKEIQAALDHNIIVDSKKGTVGAVALDCNGNIAAATSTGGMTNKKFGRVGDSPIIGA